MNEQPLPCPFCQHKVLALHAHSRRAKTAGGYHYFVRCPSCHTEGPRSLSGTDEAIAKWNRRAAPAQAAQADARDAAWPAEPTPEMQQAGATAISFNTTVLNKIWTANAVYRAIREVALKRTPADDSRPAVGGA
jgi:hypothetical protein